MCGEGVRSWQFWANMHSIVPNFKEDKSSSRSYQGSANLLIMRRVFFYTRLAKSSTYSPFRLVSRSTCGGSWCWLVWTPSIHTIIPNFKEDRSSSRSCQESANLLIMECSFFNLIFEIINYMVCNVIEMCVSYNNPSIYQIAVTILQTVYYSDFRKWVRPQSQI